MRQVLAVILLLGSFSAASGSSRLQMATFRCNVTPEIGEPLIWVTPAVKVEDPLWAKGVLLQDGQVRYVLCAIDWCGIGGSTDLLFRGKMAAAAGTTVDRVVLQSVHQHTAPYVDGDAYKLMKAVTAPPLMMSDRFLRQVTDRLAQAVKEAVARLESFDRVGLGQAQIERVASARRIQRNGQLITRYSTSGSKPEMAALPEGAIDPALKTVTLATGLRPLARLHYYATHPQTFCCDGRISGDFVSAAREKIEREEKVFQIHFTGCAGDVTVGKYNDGSLEAREALAERLERGMKASIAATSFEPANWLRWRRVLLSRLPRKASAEAAPYNLRLRLAGSSTLPGQDLYRAAQLLAFTERVRPLEASALQIGRARILHLPGEPMLEFQRYAQAIFPGEFIAIAGYGDISPGYLCTDAAFEEGGYEPTASNSGPGTEARIKAVIRKLLGR